MRKNKFSLLLASVTLLSVIICWTAVQPHSQAAQPNRRPAMNNPASAAANEFGFALFDQLHRQAAGKNVFLSPLSIATALTMAYNGAAGTTQQAMARTLKFGGASLNDLNQANAELLAQLKGADPKIELTVANSLWARRGVRFKEDFLARNRQFFQAEVTALDFASPTALNTINGWVNQNTKGKIPKIIDRINGQQVLFLINAVYFKGQWQKRFDAKLTRNEPFHLLGGQQKQLPMMSQAGTYQYLRSEKFQAVSLPYGQGGASLYLFLPDANTSLAEFLKGLNYQNWQQWLGSFRSTPGDVKLPRFKLDYESNLNNALKALGMEIAFQTGRADFSGMRAERDLFISEVLHKAVAEVNEEGTEASAATSVGMSVTSMRPVQQRFNFVADRPFLMAICNQQTGAILFLGAVLDPK